MYFDHRLFLKWMVGVSIITLFVVFLGGCGTTRATQTEDTGYLMISKGKAGVLGAVGAGADYCRVTRHNLEGISFQGQLIYDDQGCRIDVVGANND